MGRDDKNPGRSILGRGALSSSTFTGVPNVSLAVYTIHINRVDSFGTLLCHRLNTLCTSLLSDPADI